MTIRTLISESGAPFDSPVLEERRAQLDLLSDTERELYRNRNAEAIARNPAKGMLIVSGPGTGKSYLFNARIDYWFESSPKASVLVTSFVRKLVADLENDIQNDAKLTDEQKNGTAVLTLHKLARSIVEKNGGTRQWPFQRHFRIIGQSWKETVWEDVLAYYDQLDNSVYSWKCFEPQLNDDDFKQDSHWSELKQKYFELCGFYNAAGFADLIIRAGLALQENGHLTDHHFAIIDEYQDFNRAEDLLLSELLKNVSSFLIVGDDDQVLYETLKCGRPTLIRDLYCNRDIAKVMLPFSTRNSYHISMTAAHFIQQNPDTQRVDKIYLPLKQNRTAPKVHCIACADPAGAVDYIERFVGQYAEDIEQRRIRLRRRQETDPFLLILTPIKHADFYCYRRADETLSRLLSTYKEQRAAFSKDYYRILDYYTLAKNPRDNFMFRKVLFHEGRSPAQVHTLIVKTLQSGKKFCDLDLPVVKDVLKKCDDINGVISGQGSPDEIVRNLSQHLSIHDKTSLKQDIEQATINKERAGVFEWLEEERAEFDELEQTICAVEMITIVGAKGLSADHVIVVGFDDANMRRLSRNAFYVALTRARKSLRIITALKCRDATKAHDFLDHLPETHVEFYKYRKSGHCLTPLGNKEEFVDYLGRCSFTQQTRSGAGQS